MKSLRFFLPRIEYILLLAVFWGIAASGPRILNFDGDLPRHLLHGSLILQTRHVETTDMFSFRTAGQPSYPHEWLSQVLFASAYQWLELDGVVLLTAIVITLTWTLVYRQAMHNSRSFFAALLVTALGVAASQIHVLPRPHIFTYLLSAVWITLLEALEENKLKAWWLLPLVMLVWVNMHGMFVLGMIILAIYIVGDFLEQPSRSWFLERKSRLLLGAAGLSLAATFLSPSGPGIWNAIASLGSNDYITSKIPEYRSADFHLPETWPFLLLLILTVIGFARGTQRTSWRAVLLAAALTGLALYSSRMIPLFAVIVAPIAARALAAWGRAEYPQSGLWKTEENVDKINSTSNGWIWLAVAILLLALLLRSGGTIDPQARGNSFDERFFPVQAVSWLNGHPQHGRMFNEFDWGGYLLLRLWPQYQIFMDGHTHIYGEALTREYEQVITLSEGWEQVLEKYDVTWVIMRRNSALAQTLAQREGWAIAYEDTTAIILTRK